MLPLQNSVKSKNNLYVFGFVTSILITTCAAQLSPCPDVFSYQVTEYNTVVGKVVILSPSYGTHKLEISMQLRVRLNTTYVGKIVLIESNLQDALSSGGDLIYIILFPIQFPLPTIVTITFNGVVICAGRRESGQVITTIKLQHTLKANLLMHYSSISQKAPLHKNNYGGNQITNNNSNYDSNNKTNEYEAIFNNNNNLDTKYDVLPSLNNYNNNYRVQQSNYEFTAPPPPPPPPRTTALQTTLRTTIAPRPSSQAQNFADSSYEGSENGCGVRHKRIETYVFRGEDVDPGDWPWTVAIFQQLVKGGLKFICSGTLLSKMLVITAAHCIYQANHIELQASKLFLRLGVHNIQEWGDELVTTGVREVLVPDNFSPANPTEIDAALLVMKKPVKYTEFIIPICLWSGENILSGISGKVVGWGRDENQNEVIPEPRLTEVPIVSQEECRQNPTFNYLLNEHKFCAGNRDGAGPCSGDSGAGLYVFRSNHFELKGIVSYSLREGKTGCNLYEYVIYTDTAAGLRQWIRQNIENIKI